MTTLILVRHGQSVANLERIFAGHTDIPLTELGLLQAERTAAYLEEYPIDCIYSSDLLRAQPDNGESIRALSERLLATVVDLVKKHPGKTLALFTHAAALRSLATVWMGYPIEEAERIAFPANASVTLVDFDENLTPHLRFYGYADHQAEAATSLPTGSV